MALCMRQVHQQYHGLYCPSARRLGAAVLTDDVKVLLVLWYGEVHMDEDLSVLGGHWIDLQLARALALLGGCWCFASGLGILFGCVLDQASTNKCVVMQV